MIWRGPIVTQTLLQLFRETRWKDLDYLIIDLPPGTGDTQLTLSQQIPVAGAVIITTPQDIALLDAKKAKTMFDKVAVPVLGLVENMSSYTCPNCGHEAHIFGKDGGKLLAVSHHLPYLGDVPLDIRIREETDNGNPTTIAAPDSDIAKRYRGIALRTHRPPRGKTKKRDASIPENRRRALIAPITTGTTPMSTPETDTHWMQRALELARQGIFSTAPNPRVGCVIVKDGNLIGSGYHVRAGEAHAETAALAEAGRWRTRRHRLRQPRTLRASRPHSALRQCADCRRRRPRCRRLPRP